MGQSGMAGRRKLPKPPPPHQVPHITKESASRKGDVLSEIAELLPGTSPVPERVRQVIQQTKFQGPIPHPDIFKQYGEVIVDAPERILQVFEKDSAHAREIQFAALKAQVSDNRRVHWMAWTLVAGGYGLSLAFGYLDKDVLAGIILATTLAGTITGFLQGRKPSKADSNE